jgi:hypothetical protein
MAKGLIDRDLTKTLHSLMDRREILLVRGPRQAGKTTLLRMLESSVPKGKDSVFLNMELPDFRREFARDPLAFARRFRKERPLVMFMDEIQACKDAGPGLKLIYDTEKIKMVVSGSSTMELGANVLPSLVGRAFPFELLTFGFGEFLRARDEGLARIFYDGRRAVSRFLEGGPAPKEPPFPDEFRKHLEEYLVLGGYPSAVLAKRPDEPQLVLNSIRAIYLEKDISSIFRIRDSALFEDFARALAFSAPTVLNVSEMAGPLGISHSTAMEFLAILENTYIIALLRPYHKNLVTELRKARRICFLDSGLRNSLIGNFTEFGHREDRGKLLENYVFRELRDSFAGWELKYWRTTAKAEVDFVLVRGERPVPVEVKLGGRPGRSFWSFCDAYKPDRALVVTLDSFSVEKKNGTRVCHLPAFCL